MSDHEGEKELVLGNKQLLGIFFVATLLCGVFFAMGYVVGGNSAKAGAAAPADTAPVATTDGKREEPQPRENTAMAAAPVAGDTAPQSPGAEPKMTENPVASSAEPTAPAQVIPPPKRVVPVTPPAASQSAASGVFLSEPEQGTSYLQVAAVQRPSADDLVLTLRRGGLPVILAKSSKPELFAVLVGPYRSTLSLADAKKKLTDLGYGDVMVRKQ